MNYWLVHREQVTGKLQIDSFVGKVGKDIAELKQRQLRRNYHDAVVLSHDDVNALYLDAYQTSVRNMKNLEEKRGKLKVT